MSPLPDDPYRRFQELQNYIGWTEHDVRRVYAIGELCEPFLPALVDDFYATIEHHPDAARVITGGTQQVERLKTTLLNWLRELFQGDYGRDYASRHWKAGYRHVEIKLNQVYANAALSRLRGGLLKIIEEHWEGDSPELIATLNSLNALLDLDLALIQDAYETEYTSRLMQSERLTRLAEHRRVTEALHRSEAALGALLAAAPCMILILRQDYTIQYFSPFAERLSGYSAAEVLGREYDSIFASEPETKAAIDRELQLAFSGIPTHGFETPIQCKDGAHLCMVWNAQQLENYQGSPAVLAVGQDITMLKQAQEKSLHSERLAAIGQMMTGLAHESRNALQRSQACLEMLALEVRDRTAALDLVARIQKAQDHLHHLYEEVRGYAAPIRFHYGLCDLGEILRETWEHLALQRQGRDVSFHVEDSGIILKSMADRHALEQVFRNILENSLAACRDPVRIQVRCTSCQWEGQPALRISIQDNGPGLTADQRDKIFEPFYTTKTHGTGLGMAIVKRIIDGHSGQIAVGADCARGAEIVITIPRGNI